MKTVLLFFLFLLATACSLPCDKTTTRASCDGQVLRGCVDPVGRGIFEALYFTRGKKTCPGVCREEGDHAVCLDLPATPCVPEQDAPRCEGDSLLTCEETLWHPTRYGYASGWARKPCEEGETCAATVLGARCVPAPLTACPTPADQGCLDGDLISCAPLSTGDRVVVSRQACPNPESCEVLEGEPRCVPPPEPPEACERRGDERCDTFGRFRQRCGATWTNVEDCMARNGHCATTTDEHPVCVK